MKNMNSKVLGHSDGSSVVYVSQLPGTQDGVESSKGQMEDTVMGRWKTQ